MKPKEKAKELFNKFNSALIDEIKHNAARNFVSFNCALIAVDEIMKAGSDVDEYAECYWQEVKIEIEKL
jgi:hypothetical protein